MSLTPTYTLEGLHIFLPYDALKAIVCLCGCSWQAHNPQPQDYTAHDRYCLQCPCLGFVPALRALRMPLCMEH